MYMAGVLHACLWKASLHMHAHINNILLGVSPSMHASSHIYICKLSYCMIIGSGRTGAGTACNDNNGLAFV